MKKSRWIVGMTFGTLIFALTLALLVVPSAQARPFSPSDGSEPAVPDPLTKNTAKVYDPAAFSANWGISPDTLIACDPTGDLLAQVQPGNVQSFHSLQAVACKKQAIEETNVASINFGSGGSAGSCGYSGVYADGRDIKVYGFYTDTRYVYLQCGKKVGVYGPPSCNCQVNSRYTYDCKKPPTVYITIPCTH